MHVFTIGQGSLQSDCSPYKRNNSSLLYLGCQPGMACSKYEYVKHFEQHRTALEQTFIVVRIDGRGFTKFSKAHKFLKPNDLQALQLMNQSARLVMQQFQEIFIAYGQSDEYSFGFINKCGLFNRRIDKIQTCLVSSFTSAYVLNWPKYFPETPLKQTVSFDARVTLYPNETVLKDYFRWRQVDCHINNLYNTTFWCLVKTGMTNTEVENKLKDTNSGQKNEILFTDFNINYNHIEQIFRRGTILCYRPKQTHKLSTNICKQIGKSITQLGNLSGNMKQMQGELVKSEQESDKVFLKQLATIQDELSNITAKYQKIQEENLVKKSKSAKMQYNLDECHEDMIKEQFWEIIRTT